MTLKSGVLRCDAFSTPRDGLGARDAVHARLELKVDAVDFVAKTAVVVFEPQHRGPERNVNEVVPILFRHTQRRSLRADLRPCDARSPSH